jgi:tetratricopeptide (TPR) repeat protein
MSRRSKKQPLKEAAPAASANPRVAAPVMVREPDQTGRLAGPGYVPKQQASQTWLRREWLIALLLFAALLVAYYPALHGGLVWDDATYLVKNQTLQTLAGLRAIWLDPVTSPQYYPLTFTLFWAVHQICGLNPLGYHLVTLLLHGVTTLLFWQLLERLRVRGALLAAAIFAFHPVNVMSVAWMTELKNTLSCSLALGAAWAYVRFAGLGVYEQASKKQTPWRWYVLSLVLFQLAMLAKTAVSFLPVSLLLVVWWQRDRLTRRDLLSLIPMLGISVGMGAFTIYFERHAGGASGADFTMGFLARVLVSGRSFWFYLGKLLWPWPLIFIYPRWEPDVHVWWQWLYPVATVSALLGSWLARRRIGKGVFVALMHFYISTSMLVLMVVLYMMRYSFVADHWQYFGCLAIFALVGSALARAADWLRREPWGGHLATGLGVALILGLGVLTRAQSAIYSDAETLWNVTLARNPQCWVGYYNLGDILLQRGRPEEAAAQLRQALQLRPGLADAHTNLGLALFHLGRATDAIAQYRIALQTNPDAADAHNDLGNALNQQGDTQEAIAEFREALRLDPHYADAHNNLGNALFQQGHVQEAVAEYRETLRINPGIATAHVNLGNALFQQGLIDDAIAQYRDALQINPDNAAAHSALANALLGQSRAGEAIPQNRENPADAGAHKTLGNALFQQGRIDDAIAQYREAIAINPADAETHNNLGFALFKQGQIGEAVAEYRRALQIDPTDAQAHINLGNALLAQGDAAEALVHLQKALELHPSYLALENKLAWVLATASQPSIRDGARAVQLATQANQSSGGNNPLILRTLAAAYAQAGHYPDAVQTAQKALQLAQAQSNAALAGALPREIKLYEAGRPFEEAQ